MAFILEGEGIEVIQTRTVVRIADVQRLSREIRQIQIAVVDAIRTASLQGVVTIRTQGNGEAGVGTSDPGNFPTFQQMTSAL